MFSFENKKDDSIYGNVNLDNDISKISSEIYGIQKLDVFSKVKIYLETCK